MDGITTPFGWGRTHPSGNSKGTCTQRSVSTGHRSTDHRLPAIHPVDMKKSQTGHRPLDKWALYKNFQVSQSPVTGLPATGHWTLKISTQGNVSIYRSPVIRLYINLHLVRLKPWAWSSLIITQKEFYYPWKRTIVICPIPIL